MSGAAHNREHDQQDPEGFYRLLGVSPSASPNAIALAWFQARMRLHGKKDSESLRKWFEEAHAVLSDPIKRAEYDGRARLSSPPLQKENVPPPPKRPMRIRRRADLDTSPKIACVPPVLDFGTMQSGQNATQRVAVTFQNIDPDENPVWIENDGGSWYFINLGGQKEVGNQSWLEVMVTIPDDMKPGRYEATVGLGINRPDTGPSYYTLYGDPVQMETSLRLSTFTVRVVVPEPVPPLLPQIAKWLGIALLWVIGAVVVLYVLAIVIGVLIAVAIIALVFAAIGAALGGGT